jgi:uncharacterized protein
MMTKLFIKDARLRPIWRVIIYAILVVLAATLFAATFDSILGRRYEEQLSLGVIIESELAVALAVLVVSILLRRYLDQRSVASLGFAARGPWVRLLCIGVVLGAGMQAVANGVLWASGSAHVVGHAGLESSLQLIGAAIAVLVPAAFVEEMSFRGYILQNLWEDWGLVPAIVVSSIGFAALHISNPHSREQLLFTATGLLIFALWACMSLVWTKSLWLALGAHMAWNLFEGPVFGLPLSGLAMPVPTVLRQTVNGPQWLTGGSFGPEAGVTSFVALIVGLLVLRALYLKGAFADAPDTREEYARAQSRL